MEENKNLDFDSPEQDDLLEKQNEGPIEQEIISPEINKDKDSSPIESKQLSSKFIALLLVGASVLVTMIVVLALLLGGGASEDGTESPEQPDQQTPVPDELPDEPVSDYSEGLDFEPTDGGYSVKGIGTCADLDIKIPPTYEGKPVTAISVAAFKDQKKITTVVIPDSVKSIGSGAFFGCSHLLVIELPKTIEFIGESAFYYCPVNTQINVNNIVYIGDDENPYRYLIEVKNKNLTSYEINPLTELISHGAFNACWKLESFTAHEGLRHINDNAFFGCISLRSVKISRSVKSIGLGAFENCELLESVVFDGAVEKINFNAFDGCTSMKYNEHEGGLYLGNEQNPYLLLLTVKDKNIESLAVHPDTEIIGERALEKCLRLKSVSLPKGVLRIGDLAFYLCTSLSEVHYSGSSDDWASISIGQGNSYLENATVYKNDQ